MIAKPERESRRIRRAALQAAKAQGCVCSPALAVDHVAGAPQVTLRHDSWCPLGIVMSERAPGARWQAVLYPEDGAT